MQKKRRDTLLTRSTFKKMMKPNQKEVNYDKMVAHVNLNHPREVIYNKNDGTMTFQKLPMGTPTGEMMGNVFLEKPKWVPFDQLGLGVTLYFKMVKIMIIILGIATLLCLPYMIVFA